MAGSNARQKGGRKLRWPVSEIVISPSKRQWTWVIWWACLRARPMPEDHRSAAGGKAQDGPGTPPVHKKIGPVFKGEAKAVVAALEAADPFDVKKQIDDWGEVRFP